MANISQRVIWTALPNGYSADRKQLRVNVLVSPRLQLDAGAQPPTLQHFPAWLAWPEVIADSRFVLRLGSYSDELKPAWQPGDAQRFQAVWAALFPKKTPVRAHAFDDMRDMAVLTYPLAQLAQHIDQLYAQVAADSPDRLPDADTLHEVMQRFHKARHEEPDPLGHEFRRLAERLARRPVESSREVGSWRQEQAYQFSSSEAMDLLKVYHRPMQARDPADAEHVYQKQGPKDPHEDGARWPKYPRIALPAPQDFAKEIEFHQIVSTLGQHPFLLRHAALVIPFEVPADQVPSGDLSLRLEKVSWPQHGTATEDDVLPATAVRVDDERFLTRARTGLLQDGWLRLADGPFALLQMDVDGAGMKLGNLASTLRQAPRRQLIEDDEVFPDAGEATHGHRVAPMEPVLTGLPTLRTAGLMLAQLRRDQAIHALFDGSGALDDRLQQGQPIDLFAEDVVRGYRADVRDSATPHWQSLLRFDGRYELLNSGATLQSQDEESILRLGTTTSPDDSVPGVLKASEALFAWAGWSLAAPEPGRAVGPDDQVATPGATAPPGLPLDTGARPHPGSLPSLRFGHEYRVRVRIADLAGGGAAWSPKDDAPQQALSAPLRYLRYEPLETPPLALVQQDVDVPNRPWDGESLQRAALRTLNDTPDKNTVAIADRVRRHVLPGRVGHRFAEQHGMLDKNGKVDPALFNLLSTQDEALQDWQVVADGAVFNYPVAAADFDLPYLPDPLALGVALRVAGVPGIDPGDVHKIPFYGDEWDPGIEAKDWPQARPFRIVAIEGSGAAKWDPQQREFVVPLAKAERARIRYGALLTPAGVELMKLTQLLRSQPHGAEIWKKLQHIVLDGGHWMFTPWRTLELVHAVQKPLVVPTPPEIDITRNLGAARATLHFKPPLHSKSTARLDIEGRWSEPFDELDQPGLAFRDFKAHAFEQKIARLASPQAAPIPIQGPHAFADTRYRRVSYRIDATSRFREFMDATIRNSPEGAALKVSSPEVTAWVPSSAPPPAPKVVYVIPTFGWDRAFDGAEQRSWRRGGGLRVYLDRPWFSTGYNEMLAVVLPADFDHVAADTERRKTLVTQWGADPLWADPQGRRGRVETAAPRPNEFPLAVWRSPLPDMGIAGYPPQEREVPTQAGNLLHTSPLQPADSNENVHVVPHAVAYDADRGLWYADIVIRPGQAYFSFVRLALARYQPVSVPGAHLSSVVLSDFQQLAPDRLATVSDHSRRGVTVKQVSVYGAGPRAGRLLRDREHGIGGVVEIEVQRLPTGADPDLGWIRMETPPLPAPLRRRSPIEAHATISAARKRILLAEGERLLATERYAELLLRPDILRWLRPPLLHEQEIAIPDKPHDGDRLRLLVTEAEIYPGEAGEPSRRRIVYAEAIPL
jgi:hypothetical protein